MALAAATVPGCLGPGDGAEGGRGHGLGAPAGGSLEERTLAELRSIFGEGALTVANGSASFVRPVLLGKLVRDGDDGPLASYQNVTLEADPVRIAKNDTPVTGGGGETHPLEAPSANGTLWVQFEEAARLGRFLARWAVYTDPAAGRHWRSERPADLPLREPLEAPARFFVEAQLLLDAQVVATTTVPFVLSVELHWVVESSVHPFQQGEVRSNTEEMTDKFPVDVPPGLGRLVASTRYRGSYAPPSGTTVDIQLNDPDGVPRRCAVGKPNPNETVHLPVPSPEDARHLLEWDPLTPGTWTVRVGAVGNEAGAPGTDCDSKYTYKNLDDVPYTLELLLRPA